MGLDIVNTFHQFTPLYVTILVEELLCYYKK